MTKEEIQIVLRNPLRLPKMATMMEEQVGLMMMKAANPTGKKFNQPTPFKKPGERESALRAKRRETILTKMKGKWMKTNEVAEMCGGSLTSAWTDLTYLAKRGMVQKEMRRVYGGTHAFWGVVE